MRLHSQTCVHAAASHTLGRFLRHLKLPHDLASQSQGLQRYTAYTSSKPELNAQLTFFHVSMEQHQPTALSTDYALRRGGDRNQGGVQAHGGVASACLSKLYRAPPPPSLPHHHVQLQRGKLLEQVPERPLRVHREACHALNHGGTRNAVHPDKQVHIAALEAGHVRERRCGDGVM